MTQNNYLCETDQFILKSTINFAKWDNLKSNETNDSQTKQLILK